ncbi:MAG TPA: hypothetical protein PLR26_00380 [Bacilli bacterium]|nr:hypothetical protein [Bacilli bacterium]
MVHIYDVVEISRYKLQNPKLDLESSTLFLSVHNYINQEQLTMRSSNYQASKLLQQCLEDKYPNHKWSLFEIEQILYHNPNTHFRSYFQEWYERTQHKTIQSEDIEYANVVFINATQTTSTKHMVFQVFEEMLKQSHPILKAQLEGITINELSVQVFIKAGIVKKHLLINNQTIDHNLLSFSANEVSLLSEEIVPLKINGKAKYGVLIFPHQRTDNLDKTLMESLTCQIYFIPESKEIIYVDQTNVKGTTIEYVKTNYLTKEEQMQYGAPVEFCYSIDYIRGKSSTSLIKNMLIEKSSNRLASNLSNEDEIIEVVGQNFFDEARAYIALHTNIGDNVELLLDKTNIYDRYAILVMHNQKGIGYVSSKRNLDVNYYLLHNPELKATIYQLEKDGKMNVLLRLEKVNNKNDKESPSTKYEKYIYELPFNTANIRLKEWIKACNIADHISQTIQQKILLAGVYKLYADTLPHNELIFQPFLKYMLYQIFGPKSAYDFESLFQQQKELDIFEEELLLFETDVKTNSKCEYELDIIESLTTQSEKINYIDIVIDFLEHVANTIIISRKKYGYLYGVLHQSILEVHNHLKNLLLI